MQYIYQMEPDEKLIRLREEIDALDRELFTLLARRMSIALEIGSIKKDLGMPVSDPVREALLKARLKEFASDILEPRHVEELASVMIRISRNLQERGSDTST